MKTLRAFLALLAALSLFALSCNGAFVDPGSDPTQLQGGIYSAVSKLDTARTVSADRTRGLETDMPTTPSGQWPPTELIAIRFPATMLTPGLNGLPGEGTVVEEKWSKLEKDIVFELNKFRQDPVKWCRDNNLPMLDGLDVYDEFISGAGPRAGSYNFPAQIVYPSSGLHKAALHQAARGAMAHSDISRVKCYVSFSGWGENVAPYPIVNQASNSSASPAAKILNEFIRDRGVADKGHRTNAANPRWDRVGIGCYKNIIVMQFGSNIKDK